VNGTEATRRRANEPEHDRSAPVLSENSIRPGLASWGRIIASFWAMFAVLHALGMFAPTCSSRGGSLKPRTFFFVTSSVFKIRKMRPKHLGLTAPVSPQKQPSRALATVHENL
jgi:hypothetical protein